MEAHLLVPGSMSPDLQRTVLDDLARAGVCAVTGDDQVQLSQGPHLVLLDRVTSTELDSLRALRALGACRVLVVASPQALLSPTEAWQLLKLGASDVITWQGRRQPAADVHARLQRWQTVDQILSSDLVTRHLVGHDPRWTAILREIIEVASFTNTSVLVTGETGTGKEMVARLIHTLDRRSAKGQLVVLDCTTVVPTLSGSEFFGHERGAFTGAVAARDGAFATANHGTLFLDEIGELPLTLQAELLRVIQEGSYKRVGSDTWRRTDFRLVCATNRRLDDAQRRGEFRTDLYHRIAGWSCELPPLRDRPMDIVPLARHFLAEVLSPLPEPTFDPVVEEYIRTRSYVGNIRELRLLIARIAVRHVGVGPISVGDIPESDWGVARSIPEGGPADLECAVAQAVATGVGLTAISKLAEDYAMSTALSMSGNNTHRAAKLLGVTDRTVQYRRRAAVTPDDRPDPA
jgi:transcriptional regulator with GAF, ATPase, and Fis domain